MGRSRLMGRSRSMSRSPLFRCCVYQFPNFRTADAPFSNNLTQALVTQKDMVIENRTETVLLATATTDHSHTCFLLRFHKWRTYRTVEYLPIVQRCCCHLITGNRGETELSRIVFAGDCVQP